MSRLTTIAAAMAWVRGEQAADDRGSASPEPAVVIIVAIDVVGLTLGTFTLWRLGVA